MKKTKKEIIKDLQTHIKHIKKKDTPTPEHVLVHINYGKSHGGMVVGDSETMHEGIVQLMLENDDLIEVFQRAIAVLARNGVFHTIKLDMAEKMVEELFNENN